MNFSFPSPDANVAMDLSPRSIRIEWAVALLVGVLCGCPGPARAIATTDLAPVACALQSTQMDFGTMARHGPLWVHGEGEVVVTCENLSPFARSVSLSLGFLGRTSHSAMLRSSADALSVDFFLDAQMTQPWGDGVHGGPLWQAVVRLDEGERRILRLAVHARVRNRRDAKAGQYRVQVPVQLTTLPR